MKIIIVCFFSICFIANSWADLSSFPSAEGYGANAIGGRFGKVIKVTNLNSNGPGSLQAACEEKGPRIVVFDVAGVIRNEVVITHPYITIAGQTAPEPGITIAGRLVARSDAKVRLNDIVIRFLRIRPPPTTGYAGDAIQIGNADRVILDHISMSWATDETIDIIFSGDVTVQWCTVEESDPEGHGKGVPHNNGILSAYPGSGNVSIHHNLFAHHMRRVPSLSPREKNKPADFRNNLVYNFREGLGHDGHKPMSPINLIGNYYKRGPNASPIWPFRFVKEGQYYLSGNYIEGIGYIEGFGLRKLSLPDWIGVVNQGKILTEEVKVAKVLTDTAVDAYRRILDSAGSFPRDRVTNRTIKEVINGTGSWARNAGKNPTDEWFLNGIARKRKRHDSDNDGMPDSWEIKHGLDENNPGDFNKVLKSGYTAIEVYINERASMLIKQYSGID